jgi:hypothetical protein
MVVICPICGKRGYLQHNSKNSFRVKHYQYFPNGKGYVEGMRQPYITKNREWQGWIQYDRKETYCKVSAEWGLENIGKH